MIYIPTYQLNPLLRTKYWQMTNPKILPKLGQVAQNPNIVVSLSGEQTVWTKGRRFGHVKDCRKPLKPIKMTKVANAGGPDIMSIDKGTKQYSNAQKTIAIHNARIGFDKGLIAIIKLPKPMNSNITESTIPISCYYILIYSGK